ncbi:hypothetical protein TrVE_jg2047 [Triparma verrucosa]|uniref:ATP-grasp domain-containing protein n=1 Tax=Triparma verrucosa TaxID=1606542 RepID=A0A9W7BU86_9STRA|nr:hypothetical protein TrVE_jg2047 [Triparma verrucosa]
MGNLLIPSRVCVETVSESDLDFDEMTKCSPETMETIASSSLDNPAYTSEAIEWDKYTLDAWYHPGLDHVMISPPLVIKELSQTYITQLQDSSDPCVDLVKSLKARMSWCGSKSCIETKDLLKQKTKEWFVRTSMCSTKIGAHPKPATSAKEVIDQIKSSRRCLESFSARTSHSIYLFPWNSRCDISREFRVWVKFGRVVAIAPYFCAVKLDWLRPDDAEGIGLKILEFFESDAIKEAFSNDNFQNAVMDVLYTEGGAVKLIEFNPVESSGGGLFSFKRDARIFRGEEEKVVMRIVADDS